MPPHGQITYENPYLAAQPKPRAALISICTSTTLTAPSPFRSLTARGYSQCFIDLKQHIGRIDVPILLEVAGAGDIGEGDGTRAGRPACWSMAYSTASHTLSAYT